MKKNARVLELLKIMIIENAPSLSMLSLLNMSLFAIYYSKNNNVSGRYLKYLKLFEKIMDEHFINTKLKAVVFSIIFMLLGGIYKTTVLRLESDWSREFPQLADYFNFVGSTTDTIYSMLTYLIDYMVEYLKPKVHESLKVGPVEKLTDAVRGTWKLVYERFISSLFKSKKGTLLLLSAKTAILLSLFYIIIQPILPLMSPTFQDNNRSKDELLAATSVQLAVLLTVTASSIEVKRLRENLGLKIPFVKKQSTKKYERIEKIATIFFLLAKLGSAIINKTDEPSYTISNALAFVTGVIELGADFVVDAGKITGTNIECEGGFSFIDLFKALSLGTILAKITITRQMFDTIIDAVDQATS